jgi:hypothetical protein
MQVHHVFIIFRFAQSMPIAAPTAASTPAAETSKVPNAPFDLFVLDAEAPAPLAVLEPEPALADGTDELSVGVAEAAGYVAPKGLTSNSSETA